MEKMIKREEINIDAIGRKSEHVLYSIEGTKKLVVLFPGGNSNTTRPFFYYLRDYFLRNNYDVLALSYKNLPTGYDTFEEQLKVITELIYKAIMINHETKPYDEYIFVSRSIGNVIANATKIKYDIDVLKSIYVAPTSEALDDIKQYPGLIITGTKDEYLKEGDLEKISTFSNHEVMIFEDGDHNLECENTLKTIDFCKECVIKVIEFLN